MRTMNHVRDHVYGIVAHPTLTPGQKADMLKRVADASSQAEKVMSTPVVMPQMAPPPVASFPSVSAPTPAPAPDPNGAGMSPMTAGVPLASTASTAGFPPLPGPTPTPASDEIDKQQRLALAALSQPTVYPTIR